MGEKTVRIILFALFFLFPGAARAAGTLYAIDPAQTHVRFAAKMCMADILMGEFHDVRGTFYLDEKHPEKSHVEVTIGAGSATFSKHEHNGEIIGDIIASDRFLNVTKFPSVTFKSTKVVKTSTTTANVTGGMTMLGATLPFSMEVTFHDDAGMDAAGRRLAAFSAYGKFRRSAWGVVYGLDRVGIRRMDDEVTVLIDVAGNRKEKEQGPRK